MKKIMLKTIGLSSLLCIISKVLERCVLNRINDPLEDLIADCQHGFRSQRAKKVVSGSPGLVDFAIGLVNLVVNLPDGQVIFFEEFE